MMAGDVFASVQNGNLTLKEETGQTGLDNAVVISSIDVGKIRVQGATAASGGVSKINGQAFQDFDVPGGLFVKFGAGNDTVQLVRGIGIQTQLSQIDIDVAAPVPIATRTAFSITPPLTVIRPDVDNVTLDFFHTVGSVSIKTGDGTDTVNVIDAKIGDDGGTPANLSINTGSGVDLVKIKTGTKGTTITGMLDVQTFSGVEAERDFVFLENFGVQGATRLRTGGGSDTISITNFGTKKLDLDAGAGGDTAILNGVFALDSLMAKLGDGDDTLSTSDLISNNLTLDGGSGFDRLDKKADPHFSGKRTQTGWEVINGLPAFLDGGGILTR